MELACNVFLLFYNSIIAGSKDYVLRVQTLHDIKLSLHRHDKKINRMRLRFQIQVVGLLYRQLFEQACEDFQHIN